MANFTFLKRSLVLSTFLVFSLKGAYGQAPEKAVYKKFALKDSGGVYKSAVLLLYKDNTFINFGIFDNKKDLDLYVWYKSGSWSEKENRIECLANEKLISNDDIKKLVKHYYRRHRDRVLIESYYEFVHENYQNGSLQVNPEQVSDTDKKIEYVKTEF